MAELGSIEGKLVALYSYDYKGFKGEDGKEVEGGTVHKAVVAHPMLGVEPSIIQIPPGPLVLQVEALGLFGDCRCVYSLHGAGNGIKRRLLEVTAVPAAKVPARS